ncbi:L-glyceraldehyde 3-phosphate reductase [Neomegalonema perideroedes]|uniref:L-glyceraldehyde 3-phosphate reductase n=1 Tax=Neomegalonema perideroedes TaxID=217219 RepID=UPI00037660EF|nr:L-glyceraldehyde 3-phosphate reductase [Neomegalonema perideroedes]
MGWIPNPHRYDAMTYRRCGRSGLVLPALSLGLWHNFGEDVRFEPKRDLCRAAFDLGITHFDLANNYGPPPGSAETAFGEILRADFKNHRDDLVISTKAGYFMRPGPYGEWGSRKYLISSCDASLKRMGLDYVDVFYSHRFDPKTPLEETMGALDQIVRSGKALYVGISSYDAEQTRRATRLLEDLGTPCLVHQPSYSMLNRWIENDGLLDVLEAEGLGCVVFSPLAQGMLTSRYLNGAPEGSRATQGKSLKPEMLSEENLARIRGLNAVAEKRNCSLAQLALAWALRDPRVTSALIGASRVEQLQDSVGALALEPLTPEELAEIDRYAQEGGLNIWSGRGQPTV